MRIITVVSMLAFILVIFNTVSKAQDETGPTFEETVSNNEDMETDDEDMFPDTEEEEADDEDIYPGFEFEDEEPADEEEFPSDEEEASVGEEELPDDEETVSTIEDKLSASKKKKSPTIPVRIGTGLNIGVRVHYPVEINDFLTDIWTYLMTDSIGYDNVKRVLYPGVCSKIKAILDLPPFFCIESYGQFLWAGKTTRIRGGDTKDASINIVDINGGINLWFTFPSQRRLSLKVGVGGYAAYAFLDVSGDAGDTQLKGPGGGVKLLIGINLPFKRIEIDVDAIVPIGYTQLKHRTNDLEFHTSEYDYPSKYVHTGIEICPGITFYF